MWPTCTIYESFAWPLDLVRKVYMWRRKRFDCQKVLPGSFYNGTEATRHSVNKFYEIPALQLAKQLTQNKNFNRHWKVVYKTGVYSTRKNWNQNWKLKNIWNSLDVYVGSLLKSWITLIVFTCFTMIKNKSTSNKSTTEKLTDTLGYYVTHAIKITRYSQNRW